MANENELKDMFDKLMKLDVDDVLALAKENGVEIPEGAVDKEALCRKIVGLPEPEPDEKPDAAEDVSKDPFSGDETPPLTIPIEDTGDGEASSYGEYDFLEQGEKVEHDSRILEFLVLAAWGARQGLGRVNLHRSIDREGFEYQCSPAGDGDGRELQVRVTRSGNVDVFNQDRARRIENELTPLVEKTLPALRVNLAGLEEGVQKANDAEEARANPRDVDAAKVAVSGWEVHIPRLKTEIELTESKISELRTQHAEIISRNSPYVWRCVFDLDAM